MFPVVGVGASAGGMEAFSELLRALPANPGLAFVFIQHVDPTHRSVLSEILGRTTSLAVSEVSDGVSLELNHVFVIPPNTNMIIKDSVLRLTVREHRGPHLPIDHFFHSLADDRGDLAIGVILSGTASDGTQGCTAIKAAGGITFAQDEKTAKYSGMPRSAINAGCIDFVLTPKGIAQELTRIARHPYVQSTAAERAAASALADRSEMENLLNMVRQVSGVDFTHYKMSTLQRRIKRRMILHRLEHLKDYVAFIHENPTELEELYREILIHVTGFFRDPDAFEALRKHVLAQLFQERKTGDGPIRIWIPGCSTGEEVYSLAIALLEYTWDLARKNPSMAVSTKEVQIFATDISDAALERARDGLYSEAAVAEVSPERLKRFFVRLDGGYQINKSVREICIFAKQDVTKDPPFSNLDLISCRNLLIYLGPVLQKRVIPTFHYALKANGFLLLGSSESIGSFSDHFTLIDKKFKIYQKKRTATRLATYFGAADYSIRKFSDVQTHKTPPAASNVEKEVERVLMNRFVPASIVVNEQMEIVQFRGKTGAYLEPAAGSPTFSLSKMAREGLLVDLRDGIARAKKSTGPVRKDGVRVQSNGGFREVDLEMIPVRGPNSPERFYVVVFQEAHHPPAPGKQESKKAARANPSLAREYERGKRELAQLREQLQALIEDHETTLEEFKSANEEILSGNEELQSTNEELETAKEELQSSNEELTTLNEELQNRNTELSMANNDLLNLLANVNLPVVMVGNDLRIRRFTPPAEKLLNFLPGDIGRRLGEIRPNVEVDDLEALCRQVIDTAVVQEREIREVNGSWCLMRIRPYKTWDSKVDGAVISFQDIDALKRSLEQTRRYADSLIDNAREPIVILDDQYRINVANAAFYRTFRLSLQQVENVPVFDLDGGRWNIPHLRDQLQRVLSRNERIDDLEARLQLSELGSTTVLFNARRIEAQEGRSLIFLTVEDITETRLQLLTIRRQSALSELAHDAVVVRDLNGRILSWNRGAEELYGFSRDQALGADIGFLLKTHYPKPIEEIRAELIRSLRWEGELTHSAATGERKYVSSRWALLREEDGTQIVLEINNDITALRQAEENQRTLSAFLMRAQDEERRRIARELHDSTGQKLAFAKMNLQNVSRTLTSQPAAQGSVEESVNAIDDSLQEIRTLSQVLHPPLLDEAGLVSAIRWLVDGFSKRAGISIDFDAPKDFHRPPPEAELALFRVVQECLTNIHRHSGAAKGRIRLSESNGTILLEVSDTGKGFAPEAAERRHRTPVPGVGILGMKERLHQLSGTLDIRSGSKGTTVRASIPHAS
jgi:two-component system, chemotaxis family, CheB/CheR fusion protein